jgi:hypothetical protein
MSIAERATRFDVMQAAYETDVKLDFLIAASPNDGFFSQIAMFRRALDELGGIYRSARLVAVFGDHEKSELPTKWRPYFDRIDIDWADCRDFATMSYHATGYQCFRACRQDADVVVVCDADTILVRSFPELIDRMRNAPALMGVLANQHIPWSESSGDSFEDWQRISRAVIGRDIPCDYRYLLEPERVCPFYTNAGFIVATPAIFGSLLHMSERLWPLVDRFMGTYFSTQITTCLAAYVLDLPVLSLPRRYNYANYTGTETFLPDEFENMAVFHYFSTEFFNRQRIFTTPVRFEKFLRLELSGANAVFQALIRRLTGGEFPFLGAEATTHPAEDQYDDLRTEVAQLSRYAKSLEHALRESQAYAGSLENEIATLRRSG